MQAIESQSLDVCRLIYPTLSQKDLNRLLFIATKHSRRDIISYAIHIGANPNSEECPLAEALYNEDLETADLLISLGASIHAEILLKNAAYFGSVSQFNYILENGGKIDEREQQLLHLASCEGNVDVVNELINRGAKYTSDELSYIHGHLKQCNYNMMIEYLHKLPRSCIV